jgi:Asp-tRNA(Asn)/Glu-tRNA(Gln) amidotransferase A subunit family amidase
MARTVRDTAKLLDVIVGYDTKDPFTVATCYTKDAGNYEAALGNANLQTFRVGILANAFGPDTDPDSAPVNDVIFRAIALLKNNGVAFVEGLDLPALGEWLEKTAFYTLQSKHDIGAFFRSRPDSPFKSFMEMYESKAFHPLNDAFYAIANAPEDPTTDANYYRMRMGQEEFRRAILSILADNQIDFLLFPTAQMLPPTREELYSQKWSSQTFPTNTVIASQAGLPAMSMPAGFTSEGIPVGLELVGKPFAEAQLLQFAYAYEKCAMPRKAPKFDEVREESVRIGS